MTLLGAEVDFHEGTRKVEAFSFVGVCCIWQSIFRINISRSMQFRTSTECKYTHVEGNRCRDNRESLVCTYATPSDYVIFVLSKACDLNS